MGDSANFSTRGGTSALTEPKAALSQEKKQKRVTEQEASQWASILAGALPLPPPRELRTAEKLRPSEGVNMDDTEGNAANSAGSGGTLGAPGRGAEVSGSHKSQTADTHGVNDPNEARLILNVDSETLGRVQLIVDREEGGVRVLVGTESAARSRFSEGKHTLGEALSAAGVRVNSLRIVAQSEVGTVLAQEQLRRRNRSTEEAEPKEEKARPRHPKGKKNNLNLVG